MSKRLRPLVHFNLCLLAVCAGYAGTLRGQSSDPPRPSISTSGVRIEGNQFLYDAGFDLIDWNGDGLLDVFLPNTAMMSFAVHLNEGTTADPRFGLAVGYPVNLTETEPQTIEHAQSWTRCDLNHDGLFDLVMFDGQLRYVPNTGTLHGPNHWRLHDSPQYFPGSEPMIRENARFSTGPESMYWNKGIFARQVLTLTAADWDGDGLEDLIVCRFNEEAPGVAPTGGAEQWTAWGRLLVSTPTLPPPENPVDPAAPLSEAPPRSTHFFRNVGTKDRPEFDAGVELLTSAGEPVVSPNPIAADVDGDGLLDLVGTETAYRCNAFRVDWPTNPAVIWYRRTTTDPAIVEPFRPVTDADGQAVPAGVQVRFGDIRHSGVNDLLVMDGGHRGSIRWYRNEAGEGQPLRLGPAIELRGRDFGRFEFMAQPVVVDWFAPGSRDLLIHGNTDAHCKWALRRTAVYRNEGVGRYEFAGYLSYRGDAAMVPPDFQTRPYDAYGSAAAVWPDTGDGQKRLILSVNGQLYLFSDLGADGLTFNERTPINLAAQRNRCRSWQDIPIADAQPVRYIRISNDRNGMGNLRDSFLHIVSLEATAAGRNVATLDGGVTVTDENGVDSPYYRVQRPDAMFTPGNQLSDAAPNFTTFGYYIGPAIIDLQQAAPVDRIRFLLSEREERWYAFRLPFYWGGRLLRDTEPDDVWYQYKVEVSADRQQWTTVADTMPTEMMRSFPCLVDWDEDGNVDLVLGVLNSNGIWPSTREYRLYRNAGSNDAPQFEDFISLCDEQGAPLAPQAFWYNAYGMQCGVNVLDYDGDGLRDLIIEGQHDAELQYYRNVTTAGGERPRFQFVSLIGDERPLRYPSRYTYFWMGDADGDSVADVISSDGAQMSLFTGTAAGAPGPIADLSLLRNLPEGLTFGWTPPAHAARYEWRWSREPITALNWHQLPVLTGSYSGAEPVEVDWSAAEGLPQGELLHLAARSFGNDGSASELSDSLLVATWPLSQVVLRNGPEESAEIPAYDGCESTMVDAHRPDEPVGARPAELTVRAPGEEKQKVILIRFSDLPALDGVESAVVELTTVEDENRLAGRPTLAVSCNACRADWVAPLVAWKSAGPGVPWEAAELDAGGRFASMAEPRQVIRRRHVISWDVTEAVRTGLERGDDSVSLLIRVDNTGKYIAGQGYRFHGNAADEVEARPRLRVITGPRQDGKLP